MTLVKGGKEDFIQGGRAIMVSVGITEMRSCNRGEGLGSTPNMGSTNL